MDLIRIEQLAAAEMKGRASHPYKETGNKFYHGQRTAKLAAYLCDQTGYAGARDTLHAAALFHDVANGQDDHGARGAEIARRLLAPECTADELNEICALIRRHDERTRADCSMALMLLQDADLLDHFGTFEIWSMFKYATREDLSMKETARLMQTNAYSDYERSMLHFDICREVFDEKRRFAAAFTARMLEESMGNIWEA